MSRAALPRLRTHPERPRLGGRAHRKVRTLTPLAWPRGVYSDAEALRQEAHPGVIELEDVEPEVVDWLWPDRIPLGKITIVQGDPGLGKSFLTMDIAARVSRGTPMPDRTVGLQGPANVIVLGAEDGLADTIVPRLRAAGADLSRIAAITDPLAIPSDLARIADAVRAKDARLVVIDPMMAFLGAATNSNNNQDVRRALAPVKAMAEELGVAVVFVHHLNKGAGAAMYRGGGSIGINAAARSVLVVAREPGNDDPDGPRILAPVKNNLSRMPPAIAYRLQDTAHDVAVVAWGGMTNHTAEEILAPRGQTGRSDNGALSHAQGWLTDLLRHGPVKAEAVKAMARGDGIAKRTLERAKDSLGVVSRREGFGQGSTVWWVLPGHTSPTPSIDRQPEEVAMYGGTGDIWEQDLLDLPVEEDCPRSAGDPDVGVRTDNAVRATHTSEPHPGRRPR